jgi:ABC-type ATPase involved in cell division
MTGLIHLVDDEPTGRLAQQNARRILQIREGVTNQENASMGED